jgi:chromosome segregation ATPase
LALTEELETLKQGVRSYSDQLNRLKAALAKTDNVLTGNVEAIRAMDSFRRKTTQQIYDLEQRAAPATSVVPTELPASDVSGP